MLVIDLQVIKELSKSFNIYDAILYHLLGDLMIKRFIDKDFLIAQMIKSIN